MAADSNALIDRVSLRLLGSAAALPSGTRALIKTQVERSNATTGIPTRVADAIYLIATSPNFTVQK